MTSPHLQTAIWNNNLKSLALLALYPLILMAVVWGCAAAFGAAAMGAATAESTAAYAFDIVYRYWPAILGVVCVWFVVAYFFQGSMIRALSHAHPVTRQDEPELYNLLENLCIAEGIPMPRLEIIETHARNAFASGIDRGSYAVTVTRGLLQSLSKDEVEGVLAHELTHIQNRDVRLMMVCVIFTGMLGFAAQLAWSHARYALWVPRDRKQGGAGMAVLAVLVILWIGYFATLFTRFAISRRREYMADSGAVRMTKNPDAMMRALARIAGMDSVPAMPADVQMMCIENRAPFLGLFSTHPPIESRIRAIAAMPGATAPALPPKSRAADGERFAAPASNRVNWTTRQRFPSRRKNPWVR